MDSELSEKLRAEIFMALGQASMCWEKPYEGGIFQAQQASDIGEQLWVKIGIVVEMYIAEQLQSKKDKNVR